MKPSLTFILPILILLLWGCSSSPVVKNINVSDNSEQIFIDSKINNQVAISDKDKRLLRNILNNLFLYKGLSDGDLIILEAYIEKDYIKKVALSEIALVISNNIKLRKSGKLEVSYVTNKINKEYLIESLLKKNYPFEVSFNSGYKIDADLVGSNLKYFCSSLMNDQMALIEASIFSTNQKSEIKSIIVYLKKFESIANKLREKYPNNRFELVEGLEFENFTRRVLGIDSSLSRYQDIQNLDRNIDIQNTPRKRKDFNKIYFILDHETGKSIIPIFRSYALDIDFYATNKILLGITNIKQMNDFEGVFIPGPSSFFKNIGKKGNISSLKNELDKALIEDLIMIERVSQANFSSIDLLLNTGTVKYRKNSCLERDLTLWKISLDDLTNRS
jgi:hypothetical protein